ncbi:sigma-54-dependent transcriptional regulator [Williamwhitmania taraxaci]|uniref:DNA-binding transcriptional response regulator, NtrC family, contains REC, AAA-type ATPase, and a Fis-type DNA-binding domains n=1 Tax=Williamwhitmania taraxaci TaxID=1640674 RepID=A0A1G6HAS8_9BACT|nr:sigma-54 dependent transcriptional regulator [Williamwhitmania taraxaci]SDB91397.1 DNA-binding transcriptional response regulator, NtrC family, contains REC, AAA-type ATPase, and a Fis-type DNA-binding domains [Williamwhitmania taraxaci]
MARILIIDDERSIRNTLKDILEYEKHEVEIAATGEEGLEHLRNNGFDLVFLDVKMPGLDGIEVLQEATRTHPEMPVVMISGHGNIDTAVDAIKKGAFDFLEKPLDLNRILVTVRNATDKCKLLQETRMLRKQLSPTYEMVGNSVAINQVKEFIQKVAATDARVLITGSNGTGKELVARQLHELSSRAASHFVEVNCAAIPSELIESELFGHEKGAFTTAIKQRKGKFEQADGGTIFLDEIGDMSLSAQAKVLRVLQENKITRVGGDKDIDVSVRVIAATNKNLLNEIEAGNFREDLYHRLSVIVIKVPSLNERTEDIPLLVNHFLTQLCTELGVARKNISVEAMAELQEHQWRGNIRELKNVVERLIILSGPEISLADVKMFATASFG